MIWICRWLSGWSIVFVLIVSLYCCVFLCWCECVSIGCMVSIWFVFILFLVVMLVIRVCFLWGVCRYLCLGWWCVVMKRLKILWWKIFLKLKCISWYLSMSGLLLFGNWVKCVNCIRMKKGVCYIVYWWSMWLIVLVVNWLLLLVITINGN